MSLRLFPDTAVPDQQRLLTSLTQRLHPLAGLLPQDGADVVGEPVGSMEQIADAFGAGGRLSGTGAAVVCGG